jgi:alpha-tubulin suppressor-like RCC1 family protein
MTDSNFCGFGRDHQCRALILLTWVILLSACSGNGSGAKDDPNACGMQNCSPYAVVSPPSITAYAGQKIELDGSRSTPSSRLTYKWQQTEGDSVPLSNSNEPIAQFVVPTVTSEKKMTFRLVVSNGNSDSFAEIGVTIKPLTVSVRASTSTATVGVPVTLEAVGGDGSGSLQYQWEQIDIGDITLGLNNATTAKASFTTRIVPQASAATFRVKITNKYGVSALSTQSINLAAGIIPSITAVTPSYAAPGEEVKVSGAGFTGAFDATLSNYNNSTTSNFSVISDHEIRLTIPTVTASTYTLQIQNSGGIGYDNIAVSDPIPGATQITAGHSYFCALIANSIHCWGDNSYGQIGDRTKKFRAFPTTVVNNKGVALTNVKLISSGSGHGCALLDDNSVFCWGANSHHELANGQTTDSTYAQKVAGLPGNISSIESGAFHQCATTLEGQSFCWGYNGYGQLGYSTQTSYSETPRKVQNLPAIERMSLGVDHSCGITMNDHELLCWGRNDSGQLGNGNNVDSVTAAKVSFSPGLYPIDVAAGPSHTCALLNNFSVFCWGDNSRGQLGTKNNSSSNTPTKVELPPTSSGDPIQFSRIFASRGADRDTDGMGGTCAITNTKKVYCWGDNSHGQIGDYTYRASLLPNQVLDLANADSLAMGKSSNCAIVLNSDDTGKEIRCWGAQNTEELGLDEIGPGSRPMIIDGSEEYIPAIALSTGGEGLIAQGFSCALLQNQTVSCWGHNSRGQLGNGTTYNRSNPTPVGLTDVTALSSGTAHSCAISAGTVYCWGANESYQLGSKSSINVPYEAAPIAVPGLSDATSIAAGMDHTCAIISDREIWCWGKGYKGLQKIAGLPNIRPSFITSGSGYSCAILESEKAYCWGGNTLGQLGNGTNLSTALGTPVSLPEYSKIQNIDAGTFHTCASTIDGRTYCWGSNEMGQLGYTGPSSNLPIAVTGISDARQVQSAGLYGFFLLPRYAHTCALIESNSGSVSCWGSNLFYQLGNDSRLDKASPSVVKGLYDIKQISSSGMHSCALYTDGKISCWGGPFMAQLGQRPLKPRAILRAPD